MKTKFYAITLVVIAAMSCPTLVSAKCRTVYENYCFEYDKDNNKCRVWERQSRDVCDGEKDNGFNSNPRECFVCDTWNKDGTCKTTHKTDC
jgi:hypothetical protein